MKKNEFDLVDPELERRIEDLAAYAKAVGDVDTQCVALALLATKYVGMSTYLALTSQGIVMALNNQAKLTAENN